MDYDRNDALLHWLFRQTQGDAWFRPNEENISSGVALRVNDGATNAGFPEFRVFPYENASLEPFETAVSALNPVVAIKVRSAAVHAALADVAPDDKSIYVDAETRIQILDTMLHLPQADREQCAAFLRDERVMIIWSESLDRIVPLCQDFEERLIKLLWRSRPVITSSSTSASAFGAASTTGGAASISASANGSLADHGSSEAFVPGNANANRYSRVGLGSRPASLRGGAGVSANARGGHGAGAGAAGGIVRGIYGEQGREYEDDPEDEKMGSTTVNSKEASSDAGGGAGGGAGAGVAGRPHDPRGRAKARGYTRTWYGRKVPLPPSTSGYDLEGLGYGDKEGGDNLKGDKGDGKQRPIMQYAPLYNGLAAGLALVFVGASVRTLLMEWMLDGDAVRFALIAVVPLLYCVSLFFALQIIQNLSMSLGPIAHYHTNSKYYSAVRPPPSKPTDNALPHITIQMPVYKESLAAVLAPSIQSIKKAMQTYARQGGTSAIFVCDDGLRLLSAVERDERLAFYANHNVGWVARPRHEEEGEGFKRRGRFKKASNMNYGLALSLKMERHLERLVREARDREGNGNGNGNGQLRTSSSSNGHRASGSGDGHAQRKGGGEQQKYGIQYQNRDGDESVVWGRASSSAANPLSGSGSPSSQPLSTPTSAHTPATVFLAEDDLEERALGLAIEEVWEESGRRHRPWAANGRATRIGEIVLLVDSDTVVPEDCLRDAAREMGACPNVAIIQHESDVMQVAHHYFENGIAYFTRRINKCISISCANGEVAPFMGHNAFLRWKAIQDAVFVDPADGKEKIWSESNVSEDFDMALRLILRGYIVRWATYSKGGFKEGVSLSVDDELNRWQKYSYGCNELLFNPIVQWWRKGPINRQIHTFLWSKAPLHYKISMMAYMFSYYGIAGSITISLINYVLLGFQFPVDGFFMHSFEIFLATTVVFWGSGTVGYTLLEYRLGQKKLLPAFIENLMWIPFFFFFFGGLSIPVTQAILAHLFSYNIQWSATIKEVQRSNFFKEIPKIARRFWFPMSMSIIIIAGMILCSTSLVPFEWRIDGSAWAVILPLSLSVACHILFPIVLNPWLMVFSY